MSENDGYIVNDYEFSGKAEYEQAKREWETICNLEKKMTLGDPKVALSLYNQAVSKRTFKSPVGYDFLKRLRDTIVSCGLVDNETLNRIPVASRVVKNNVTPKDKPKDKASSLKGADDSKLKKLYEKEKKKRIILTVAVISLVSVIIAMFAITLSSKYSFVTYFTDYENDIREQVINEYEEWEHELEAREQAIEDVEE